MKNKTINVRIDSGLDNIIKDITKKRNITKSKYIIQCIEKDVYNQGNNSKELTNCIMSMTNCINNIKEDNCTEDTYNNLLNEFIGFEYKFIESYERVNMNKGK